ncbi:hypothetical protein LguiB_035964 [Lonicera macranthoides]
MTAQLFASGLRFGTLVRISTAAVTAYSLDERPTAVEELAQEPRAVKSSPWPALVRSGVLRYRRHQPRKRKRLSAPSHLVVLFCPPGDSTKRFFLSRDFARPFHFRAGGNGIRTHDTIFLYVDLANQCLKPLSHTSKLLIGIGCAGWLPERRAI